MIHLPSPRDAFAGYRWAVSLAWARWQQLLRECPDCRRSVVGCRCGGGDA